MRDTVTIALIAAAPGMLASIIGLMNNYLANQHAKTLAAVKEEVLVTRENLVHLEKNTNSMKDELIKVTGDAEFAKGLKEGSETKKKEK